MRLTASFAKVSICALTLVLMTPNSRMLKIHSGRLQIRGKGGGVPYDFMEVSQSEHENLALYVSLLCDSKKTSS